MASQDTAPCPMATKDMAKSSLQTHSNQAPNLKFQLMAAYFFFFYKKLGNKTLESEREMFLLT